MISDVAQIGQEIRMLRRIAVTGDLGITVVRDVAVRGTLIDRHSGGRAARTRRITPIVGVDVVGLVRRTFRTHVVAETGRASGTTANRCRPTSGPAYQYTVAITGVSRITRRTTTVYPIIVVVMPEMLHVHDILQQLRYHLHLVVIRVMSRVVMFASGRRRAAVARYREFFAGHTAGWTADEIRRQGISALISASATPRTIFPDRFELHTHVQAFVEATGWTFLPRSYGDRATSTSKAHVIFSVLDSTLEETFARFARENPIMETAYLVATNRTRTVD